MKVVGLRCAFGGPSCAKCSVAVSSFLTPHPSGPSPLAPRRFARNAQKAPKRWAQLDLSPFIVCHLSLFAIFQRQTVFQAGKERRMASRIFRIIVARAARPLGAATAVAFGAGALYSSAVAMAAPAAAPGPKGLEKEKLVTEAKIQSPAVYQSVYNAVAELLDDLDWDDGSWGPVFVRLGWHASGE